MTGLVRSDGLALELEHEPQHAVGRRVLGTHVDDHRLVGLADLALEGGGLGLGEAQHRAHLPEAVQARLRGQPLALLGGPGR